MLAYADQTDCAAGCSAAWQKAYQDAEAAKKAQSSRPTKTTAIKWPIATMSVLSARAPLRNDSPTL